MRTTYRRECDQKERFVGVFLPRHLFRALDEIAGGRNLSAALRRLIAEEAARRSR